MKLTSDKVFFDTNILVYAHTDIEIIKQKIAQELISEYPSSISTQVLQELANTLNRKFKQGWGDISKVLKETAINSNVLVNTSNTIETACQIADRYGFSFYDSMIISAAIESECTILFTEDLQDGQIIQGQLIIKNPFNS